MAASEQEIEAQERTLLANDLHGVKVVVSATLPTILGQHWQLNRVSPFADVVFVSRELCDRLKRDIPENLEPIRRIDALFSGW